MITYKTTDILKRASQLADLENSDFIGWNEKVNLLNESYRKLYQIVINNNDKYYLKKIKISELVRGVKQSRANETHYFLPSDFYQLCAIQTTENQTPLLRKSPSEPVGSRRYEIINEEVVIYGNADSESLDLCYYPIPLTLSTSAPDRKLESVQDTILDCNNNGFLCVNADGDVYVHNVAKGIDTEPVTMGLVKDNINIALLGRKYAFIQMQTDEMYFIDLINKSYVDVSTGNFKVAKKDNELYFFEKNENIFRVFKESEYKNDTFRRLYADNVQIVLPEGYLFVEPDVWTFKDNLEYVYIPYQKTGDVMRLWKCSSEEAKESVEVTDWKKNTIINGDLYSINYDICINGAKLISDADFYSLIGFNKADGSTGYGVSVINDDGDLIVKSVYMDTELNFPNNFYFNYIAYMLAVAYKTKQNADSTQLEALADAEELAFYDTLNRDVSNVTRITNVYSGRVW